MDLNDIKGILEIDGAKYDPKEVLHALIEQGLKIHTINGSLLVGRKFIDPSPNLATLSVTCPILNHCKIFDQLRYSGKTDEIEDNNSSFSSYKSTNSMINKERSYIDSIEVSNDDFDIQPLFTDINNTNIDSSFDSFDFSRKNNSNSYFENSNMVGISPVTKYGNPSQINISKIPTNLRGACINCGSVINTKWKHCAKCGCSIE